MAQMDLFGAKPTAGGTREDYLALVDELSEHDRRYYVEAAPTISDLEYDRLLVKLRELEAAHPDWDVAWSPTKRVGYAPISEFPKVERAVAMLSLDNKTGLAKTSPRLTARIEKPFCNLVMNGTVRIERSVRWEPKAARAAWL